MRWAIVLVTLGAFAPSRAAAQQVDSTPRLGPGASSALTAHVGVGQMKHAALGTEVGAALDVGSIGSRRVRLSVGVDYLAMTISNEQIGALYNTNVFDLHAQLWAPSTA